MSFRRLVAGVWRARRWLDFVWLAALMAYILAGTNLTPFHGDEATQIYMSRDYAYQFLQRDLNLVTYHQPPVSAQEQHLRLLNGTLPKYLIGLAWHTAGFTINDINEQWNWSVDWDYNQQNGHAPSPALLMAVRWPSVVLLALGVLPMFAIGRVIGGRWAAYYASLYYALSPALLLNGRRAMMEGALICLSMMVVWAGVWIISAGGDGRYRLWLKWGILGLVSGLALASKHSALFTVAAVYGVLGIFALVRLAREGFRPGYAAGVVASGLVAAGVFYALNPAWWGDSFSRAGEVLTMRGDLLAMQVQVFGGYDDFGDQISGFFRQVLVAYPQYYEVAGWEGYLADQIRAYEASLLRGVSVGGSFVNGLGFLGVAVLGLWTLARKRRIPAALRWLIVVWAAVMVLTTLLLTPLEWQRYYLPVYPALGLLAGVGVSALFRGEDGRTDAQDRGGF